MKKANLILVTLLIVVTSTFEISGGAAAPLQTLSVDIPPGNSILLNPDWILQGKTWRVSIASDGTEGNGFVGEYTAISADGRYVVFPSYSWNLVPGDQQYAYEDIFLHDNQTRITERISVNSAGVAANGDSYNSLDISADGRYVVFESKATNLVSGDTNNAWDVFVRDRLESTTSRVSVSSANGQSNGNSYYGRISDDGNTVIFSSTANNLVTGDSNNKWDIFAHNLLTGQTERISLSSSEVEGNNDSGDNQVAAVSSDGRYVAFSSRSTNLVPGDTNTYCDLDIDGIFNENCPDVFIRDRITGTTELVSINSDEELGNNFSILPAISADGQSVAFFSAASNLVPDDTNTCMTLYYNSGPCPDAFVRDRLSGSTERVSISSIGTQTTVDPINYFHPPAISGDGRFVAFQSSDTHLASGATNGYSQILIHDRITHETTLVSANTYRWQGDSFSINPDLSFTGRYVAFDSGAGNLVSDDANGLYDIFVRDREVWMYAVGGTVRDPLNHPLPGIKVGYGSETGESAVTDSNGEYQVYYMPTGSYTIKVLTSGYLSSPWMRTVSVPPTTITADFVLNLPTDFVFIPLVTR